MVRGPGGVRKEEEGASAVQKAPGQSQERKNKKEQIKNPYATCRRRSSLIAACATILLPSGSAGKKEVPRHEDFELLPRSTIPHRRFRSVSGARGEHFATAASFDTAFGCGFVLVLRRRAAVFRPDGTGPAARTGRDWAFSSAEVWPMQHMGLRGS